MHRCVDEAAQLSHRQPSRLVSKCKEVARFDVVEGNKFDGPRRCSTRASAVAVADGRWIMYKIGLASYSLLRQDMTKTQVFAEAEERVSVRHSHLTLN